MYRKLNFTTLIITIAACISLIVFQKPLIFAEPIWYYIPAALSLISFIFLLIAGCLAKGMVRGSLIVISILMLLQGASGFIWANALTNGPLDTLNNFKFISEALAWTTMLTTPLAIAADFFNHSEFKNGKNNQSNQDSDYIEKL